MQGLFERGYAMAKDGYPWLRGGLAVKEGPDGHKQITGTVGRPDG
jgi:hypothetical protein